jgi:hypothetical protein
MPLIVATNVCHPARLQRWTGSARTSLGPIMPLIVATYVCHTARLQRRTGSARTSLDQQYYWLGKTHNRTDGRRCKLLQTEYIVTNIGKVTSTRHNG